MMVQIQSTWLPLIDRNPRQYVASIFAAKDCDYVKATQTIICNGDKGTYLELPVDSDGASGKNQPL